MDVCWITAALQHCSAAVSPLQPPLVLRSPVQRCAAGQKRSAAPRRGASGRCASSGPTRCDAALRCVFSPLRSAAQRCAAPAAAVAAAEQRCSAAVLQKCSKLSKWFKLDLKSCKMDLKMIGTRVTPSWCPYLIPPEVRRNCKRKQKTETETTQVAPIKRGRHPDRS